MKKLLLLIAMLSVFSAKSQTFVYHPFPESNATWNVNVSQAMCFMGGSSSEDYSITFSGDTIIGNLAYQKLTRPFVQFSFTGGCTQINFPGYQGAIRQDVSNKKVYYVSPSQSAEQLLYDFTMEPGDTVKGYLESFNNPPDIVTEIDSVLVGDTYRKRWFINPCYEIYLIEGIGSTFGLLQPSPGCATDMDFYSLTCFNQDGQTQYPDPSSECQLITSINDIDFISDAVRVFPNPSSGSFTIDIGNNKNIVKIRLANMIGNIVYQKDIVGQNNINIAALPNGAYILTIIDKEKRTTNRKIISCP
ncbi:MAG: T9SS type A sorting domain-containing protein [Candidatus Saccharimonadaceae bacterium]